jgi:hypothetical protein
MPQSHRATEKERKRERGIVETVFFLFPLFVSVSLWPLLGGMFGD